MKLKWKFKPKHTAVKYQLLKCFLNVAPKDSCFKLTLYETNIVSG